MTKNEEVARLAAEKREALLTELSVFLWQHKKWWLVPIVAAMLLLGLLVFLSGSGAAPFVHTLF